MAPRLSTIAGDFCDDVRPRLMHYKVLIRLGRHINRAGWCFVSQTKLAETMGVSRQTISETIRDLVEWGYIQRKSQAETKRAICRYRVILDRPDTDEGEDGVGPDIDGEEEGGRVNQEPTPPPPAAGGGTCKPGADTHVSASTRHTCRPLPDTRVGSTPDTLTTVQRRVTHTTDVRVRAGSETSEDTTDDLGWLLTGTADHVVEHLIRPLSRLRMRPQDFPAPKLTLAAIRDRLAGEADAVLAAAALALTGARTTFPSEAQVVAAIEKARTTHAAPIVLGPDSPSWAAWLAHYRETGHPRRASLAESQGRIVVTRLWPPGAEPTGRDAA